MMERKRLIGLTENFGIASFNRIVESGFEVSKIFNQKLGELIEEHGLRKTPWEPAANFLRDQIIPIMDKENELECYMVMYLIHHIGVSADDDYERNSPWQQYRNESSPFSRIHTRYSGHWEAVIRGLLAIDGVEGTTLERYLKFPERLVSYRPEFQFNRDLFAIAHSFD